MIGVMVWKESREHWSVWLTLATVAVACLVGAPVAVALLTGPSERDAQATRETTAAVIAWVYGMVCGGMLLAGEREENTLPFLDTLPCSRLRLWAVKALVGLGLVLAQAVLVTVLTAALSENHGLTSQASGALAAAVLFCGLCGYAWGLLFSAYGRNVLNVVGVAFLGQVAALFAITLLAAVVGVFFRDGASGDAQLFEPVYVVGAFVMLIGPVIGSAKVFSRPDALRRKAAMAPNKKPRWGNSWTALLWLAVRQARGLALVLAVVSVLAGFLVPVAGLLLWPVATALIGVVCGVSVFGDEQRLGSHRFLGEQRLPLGRVWAVKVGVRLVLAVLAALLVLTPSLAVGGWHSLNDQHYGERPGSFVAHIMKCRLLDLRPGWVFLTLWLGYGFSVGHLSGLIFRRGLVAMVVALAETLMLVSAWTPSVVVGGLSFWQVGVIPFVLLATGRGMMRPWTTGRLVSTRPMLCGFAAILFCGLWLAGSLWYRVAEVPEPPRRYDMGTFVSSLPKPEENEAGRLIRNSLARVNEREKTLGQRRPTRPLVADATPLANLAFEQQLQVVLERGWPTSQPELAAWLNAWFDDSWEDSLAAAANVPLGVVENPKNLTFDSPLGTIQQARLAAVLLVARGLQQQADGKPEVFVKHLRIGLNLARNLRHKSPTICVLFAKFVEGVLLTGLDRWLERLAGRPGLLKEANEILRRHEAENPTDPADAAQAEYLIALNSFDQLADSVTRGDRNHSEVEAALLQSEVEMLRSAWQVPWERRRLMRFLRQFYEGDLGQNAGLLQKAPTLLLILRNGAGARMLARDSERDQCHFRAQQLKLALRQYQMEHGKPATVLDVLVQEKYLPAIPLDPFDGRPFRYRLSRGEDVEWPEEEKRDELIGVGMAAPGGDPGPPPGEPPTVGPPRPEEPPGAAPGLPGFGPGHIGPGFPVQLEPAIPKRHVPAGQGILWSVGEDHSDDGGKRQTPRQGPSGPGEDLIFLVPLPPLAVWPVWWP